MAFVLLRNDPASAEIVESIKKFRETNQETMESDA